MREDVGSKSHCELELGFITPVGETHIQPSVVTDIPLYHHQQHQYQYGYDTTNLYHYKQYQHYSPILYQQQEEEEEEEEIEYRRETLSHQMPRARKGKGYIQGPSGSRIDPSRGRIGPSGGRTGPSGDRIPVTTEENLGGLYPGGPQDTSLLRNFGGHVAKSIFEGQERGVL